MSLLLKLAEHSLQGEVNDQPSETIPGQSYSIEELLQRALRGQEIPSYRGDYDDDPSLEHDPLNQDSLDLVDLQPMMSELHDIQEKQAKAAELQRAKDLIAASDSSVDIQADETPSAE